MVKIPRLQAQQELSIQNQPHIPMDAGTNVGKAISNLGSAIGGLGGALDGASKAAQGEAEAETNHMAEIEAQRWQTENAIANAKREEDTNWETVQNDPDRWAAEETDRLNQASRDFQNRVKPANEAGYRRMEDLLERNRQMRLLQIEKRRGELVVGQKMAVGRRAVLTEIQAFDPAQPVEPQIQRMLQRSNGIINRITGIGVGNKAKMRKDAAELFFKRIEEYRTTNKKLYERLEKMIGGFIGSAADNAAAVNKSRASGPPKMPDAKERGAMRSLGASGTKGAEGPSDNSLTRHIMSFEGFKNNAYDDYGALSIGYGTPARGPGDYVTKEEGLRRLNSRIAEVAAIVDRNVPKDTPDGIKAALTSLTFNAGTKWMNDGLGRAIQLKDYAEAKERFLQYTKAGGRELAGLKRRRLAEAQWFDGHTTDLLNRFDSNFQHGDLLNRFDSKGGAVTLRDWTPSRMRNVDGFLMSRLVSKDRRSDVINLAPVMKDRLGPFLKAAQDAGHDIKVLSGHRSVERQRVLWRRALARYGSVAAARKHVAPPGKSNHQQGLAVDLQYGDRGPGLGGRKTAAVQWAHANAARFGLHFRLGHEDWHIEPAGFGSAGSRMVAGGGSTYMALGGPSAGITAGYTGGGGPGGVVGASSGPGVALAGVSSNPLDVAGGFAAQNGVSGNVQIDDDGDGVPSSERTITIQDDDGHWYNIPTIVDGKEVENPEGSFAEGEIEPVGGPYETSGEAVAAAEARSKELAKGSKGAPPLPTQRPLEGEILPPLPGRIERFGDDEIPGGPPQPKIEQKVVANLGATLGTLGPGIEEYLIPMLINAAPAWKSDYLKAVEEEQKQAQRQAFLQGVFGGEIVFNKFDPDQKQIVDDYVDKTTFPQLGGMTIGQALFSMDPTISERARENAVRLIQQLQYTPKGIAQALRSMSQLRPSAESPNAIILRKRAYETVASLTKNPQMMKAFEQNDMKDLLDEAMTFSAQVDRGKSPEEAIAYIEETNSPEWKKREELRRADLKEELDKLTPDEVFSRVEDQTFDPAMNQRARDNLAIEYREVFSYHYIKHGDAEAAHRAAKFAATAIYGSTFILRGRKETQLGESIAAMRYGGMMVRIPPEGSYPPVMIGGQNSWDYLHQDFKATAIAKFNATVRAAKIKAALDRGEDPSKIVHEDVTDLDLTDVIVEIAPIAPARARERAAQIQRRRDWAKQFERLSPEAQKAFRDYQERRNKGALKPGETAPPPGDEPLFYGYPQYLVKMKNPFAEEPGQPPFITYGWGMAHEHVEAAQKAANEAARQQRIETLKRGEARGKEAPVGGPAGQFFRDLFEDYTGIELPNLGGNPPPSAKTKGSRGRNRGRGKIPSNPRADLEADRADRQRQQYQDYLPPRGR